jgi:hypothetical protein
MSTDITVLSTSQRIIIDKATGSISIVNAGPSGASGIREYMVPIWAEENDTLATGRVWSFGNSGTAWASGEGIVIFVPTGYICELVGVTLHVGGTTASVAVEIDGTTIHTLVGTTNIESEELTTPVAISNGEVLNFNTTAVTAGGTANTVTAWLRYTKT